MTKTVFDYYFKYIYLEVDISLQNTLSPLVSNFCFRTSSLEQKQSRSTFGQATF